MKKPPKKPLRFRDTRKLVKNNVDHLIKETKKSHNFKNEFHQDGMIEDIIKYIHEIRANSPKLNGVQG